MQNTPKRNSFFIPEGKYAVNTTALNPRAVEQEAAVLLAGKARDSFYGLVPLDTTAEEDTRNAALTLAKGVASAGAEMLVLTPYRQIKTLWRLADDRMAKGRAFWDEVRQMPQGPDALEAAAYLTQRMPDLEKRYDAARERSLQAVRDTRKKQERFLHTMHLSQDEKDNPYVYMFGAGAGSLGASVLGGIYFKAPKAVSVLFGLNQAQSAWEEAAENGVPRAKAAGVALLAGLAEALLESVGLGRLERAFEASKGVKRVLGSALTEFLQEGSQQTAEETIMQTMGGRAQSAFETFQSIALSAVMGAVLGGGAGAIHSAFFSGAKQFEKLGADKQTARALAAKAVEAGTSPQMAEEAARITEDQENPVNWPDNDIIKGQEELRAAAQKRDFAKEYDEIEARAKNKFKEAGLSDEEAALGAAVEKNIVKMQAAHLGLTPELAEKSLEISFNQELSEQGAKIRFIGEMETMSAAEQEAFYKTSKMTSYKEMLGELAAFRAGLNEETAPVLDSGSMPPMTATTDAGLQPSGMTTGEDSGSGGAQRTGMTAQGTGVNENGQTVTFEQGENPQKKPAVFGELPEISKHSKNKQAAVEVLPQFKGILNKEIKPIKLTETFSDEVLFSQGAEFRKHLFANLENIEGRYYASSGSFKALVTNKDVNKTLNTSNSFSSRDFKRANRELFLQLNYLLPNAILAKRYADLNGGKEFFINRYFVAVEYQGSIYIVKLTLKEFAAIRKGVFSGAVYEANGGKDYGQYNLEIVKKITPEHAALPLKEVVQPTQGSKDSIDNNAQKVKEITWAQALDGVTDNSGAYVHIGEKENFKGETYKQDVRGKTAITSKDGFIRAVITAGQAADKSTFVHEMAHIYLSAFQHVYGMEEYTAQRKHLDAWLGKPRGGVYSRAQQEKFAEGFEQFLKEGQAPVPYLKSIFEKFRAWIIRVYDGADVSKLSAAAREAYADMFRSEAADAQHTVEFCQNAKKDYGRIRATLEKIKQNKIDVKDLDGVDVEALRDFIGILKKPAPALPKRHLLTDLRRYGAQYANSGRIDKEAYKNARVYDKQTGVGDKPADWLVKHGYMEDAEVNTYEEAQAREEEACGLIERALSGEPVYRLEDRARVELHNAYREAVNMAEDAIGADYKNYEKLLESMDALVKQGYRVVEKSDLAFMEEKFEELANLRESEAFLAQEESFGRVDDARRGSADERRKEKVQKARLENLRKAQSLKKAVLAELGKRNLDGKENILKELEKAKTVEDIYKGIDHALAVIEDAYGNSEAGKAEAGRMAPPAQDWDARRVELLKELSEINQKTDDNAAWAFAAIERDGLIVPHKNGMTPEEWNVPAAVSEKQRKMNVWKAEQILDEQLRNRYYKAFEKALGKIEGLKAPQKSIILREFNNIRYRNKNVPELIVKTLESARQYVEKNYKAYMAGKIADMIKTPLFEKSGSLRTAKYSPAAQEFLKAAHRIVTLDEQTAQDSYAHAVQNQNYDEALTKAQVLQNRLLQLRAAPETMTAAEVQELYNDVNELRKAGRDEVRLEKFLRNTREDIMREWLITALAKQKTVLGAVTYVKKLANWQSILNTLFGELEVPAEVNGQMGKKKIKFMDELSLEQNQIQMQNHVRELRRRVVARFGEAYGIKNGNEYIKKINELQSETYTLDNYGEIPEGPQELLTERQRKPFKQTITKLELMFFYIQDQNPLNRARLQRAYREEQYASLFAPLSAADKKACAALMEIAQSTYGQMNEVHKRERGFTLGRVENYFPNRTERLTGGLDYLREMLANNAAPSAIKARVQTVLAVEKPVNPVSLLMGEISRNAEYIYGAESAGKLRRIFRDKQMARALEEKFGKQDGRDIYEHIIKMIDLNGPGARIAEKSQFFETMEFLFNNWVKSAIGLKPIVAIKQFASAFNYAENMPVAAWTKGFKDALAHPQETLRFMQEFSPYLVTRYEEGGMNETLGRALSKDDTFGTADKINTLTNAITVNVRLGDKFALAFGGKPYVDWLMKEKGYTKEAARAAFELATVRSQQANLKSTLNEAQLNGGNLFWRAAWAFRNQQMQYARKLFDAYADWKNGYISDGDMAKKVFMYAIVQPALYTLLSLGWFAKDDDDRKDDWWRLAASPVEQTLGAVPFGDDLTDLLFANLRSLCADGQLSGMRSYELPGIVDMTRSFNKFVKNFNAGDADLNDWLDTLAEIGQFSGFGTKQIKTQLGGVKDALTGKPVKGGMKIIGYTDNRAKKVTGDEDE